MKNKEREPFITFISFFHFSEIKRERETERLRESQREKERNTLREGALSGER